MDVTSGFASLPLELQSKIRNLLLDFLRLPTQGEVSLCRQIRAICGLDKQMRQGCLYPGFWRQLYEYFQMKLPTPDDSEEAYESAFFRMCDGFEALMKIDSYSLFPHMLRLIWGERTRNNGGIPVPGGAPLMLEFYCYGQASRLFQKLTDPSRRMESIPAEVWYLMDHSPVNKWRRKGRPYGEDYERQLKDIKVQDGDGHEYLVYDFDVLDNIFSENEWLFSDGTQGETMDDGVRRLLDLGFDPSQHWRMHDWVSGDHWFTEDEMEEPGFDFEAVDAMTDKWRNVFEAYPGVTENLET